MAKKAPVVVPAVILDPGYRENTWQGLPHYECEDCPFDTFDLAEMQSHLANQEHIRPRPAEEPKAPARSGLLNQFGN